MNSAIHTKALIDENQKLRAELRNLQEQARLNQQIMQHHQAFDLRLISSSKLRDLIDTVSLLMPATFHLDVVTLTLIDHDFDIRRILHDLQIDLNEYPNLLFQPERGSKPPQETPTIGAYQRGVHEVFFPHCRPASVAILPLLRHQKLLGYLALGCAHEALFTGNLAIEQLASVVTICLENVINNERLKHVGLTDPLTGINNRRYIEQRLQEEMSHAQRERSMLSCLFIDIDHFKRVNDQYGHQSGDDVLREVAKRIKKELRQSDSLGRFGGEEFVVLLTRTNLSDAARIAERIRASIAQQEIAITGSDITLKITVSIGATAHMPPERGIQADAVRANLLAPADEALYRAKKNGRNRVALIEQQFQK